MPVKWRLEAHIIVLLRCIGAFAMLVTALRTYCLLGHSADDRRTVRENSPRTKRTNTFCSTRAGKIRLFLRLLEPMWNQAANPRDLSSDSACPFILCPAATE